MAMLTRILAPIEFSPRCQGAVQYAAALACHFHCEISLLHVVIPPSSIYGLSEAAAYTSAPDLQAEVVTDRRARLESFCSGALNALPVTRTVLEGDPARAIVQYAKTAGCDLIVMPTHGHGPFRRFLLGSVAAKVIHDSECPVWTGPHLEHPPAVESASFPRVLCALDLKSDSRAVLAWAARFAQEFQSQLAIVHAISVTNTVLGGVYFDPDWSSHVAADVRQSIGWLQAEVGCRGDIATPVGDAPHAISAMASEWNAALLVIGRGRHGGVLGRIRTNAYAILRESPCPVVAV